MVEFELVPPEVVESWESRPEPEYLEPEYKGESERHVFYPYPCENEVPVDDEHEDGICNGAVWDIGGHSYYNGSYQCYTLYLECENCGPYDVECV